MQVIWAAHANAAHMGFNTPPAVYSLRLQPVGGAVAASVASSCRPARARPLPFGARPCHLAISAFVTPRAMPAVDFRFGVMPLTVEGRDLTTIRVIPRQMSPSTVSGRRRRACASTQAYRW
jgi:hypothetical protein